MPIGADPRAPAKAAVIRDVARSMNLDVHIPTYDLAAPQFDLATTLRDLKGASLVLADLSSERPSCYYELGLAEAVGTPVRVIAHTGTDIHQTSSRAQALYYDNLDDFKRVVHRAILDGLTSKQDDGESAL
jgi:hypothetical protein